MVGTLLQAGFELGDPRFQRLDAGSQVLDGRVLLQDEVAHAERGLLPLERIKRPSGWQGGKGSHRAPRRVLSSAFFCMVNTAVIEKARGNVQRKMRAIPFVVTSTRSPLNSYVNSTAALASSPVRASRALAMSTLLVWSCVSFT